MIPGTYNTQARLIVPKCVKCYAPVHHLLYTKTLMIPGTYARCETNYANLCWSHPGTNTRVGGSSRLQGLTTPGNAIGHFLSGYSQNLRRISTRDSPRNSHQDSPRTARVPAPILASPRRKGALLSEAPRNSPRNSPRKFRASQMK